MLAEKIKNRQGGIILYGITPPKKGVDRETLLETASRQVESIKPLAIDGLIVYDIQDEVSRTVEQRPFPYMETLDAFAYCRDYLTSLSVPRVIYRAVGKYNKKELADFLENAPATENLTVFVGASSKSQDVALSIRDAYALKTELNNDMLLGGVTIPERHQRKGNEHIRVFKKIASGCSFFVSQGVYDVDVAKQFLSDYHDYGRQHDIPLVPIIFTLTPCGSEKTLQFMKWLGIQIPQALERELLNSKDMLAHSVKLSEVNWSQLKHFADEKGIPVGCNIESISTRKAEVDALDRVAK